MPSSNFGEVFGRRLHADHHVVLVARTLKNADTTIAEVRSDHPTFQPSDPIPPIDAFGVAIQLRDFPVHEWWEDARPAAAGPLHAGHITIYDLKRDPRFRINNPFHSIHLTLPRALMDGVADEAHAKRIVDLEYPPGRGINDPVIQPLLLSLRPALTRPEAASRLFIDHVTRAVAHHVAVTYGRMHARHPSAAGLAPWQQRRATEFIDAHLDGNLTIVELARQCGLSASYFTTAFKRSVGATPHQWLINRRVERAKRLLQDGGTPLAQIALACGFANQSHFTRVFKAVTGCPPTEWRRRSRVEHH
jgi:AraC family transcriptional regulator